MTSIIQRPTTFDRVDRVKEVVGQEVLPGDDRFWILGQVLTYEIDGVVGEIPRGFTTDGASVPGWGERITGWGCWEEPQRWAGICHDWWYCQPGMARRKADRAFHDVLDSEGASWVESHTMWVAVRVGGWPAYRQNQARGPRIFV